MTTSTPHHYQTLQPFLTFFESGTPILMYHNIATYPHCMAIKEYYVDPNQFLKQISELHASGFTTISLNELSEGVVKQRPIVITFDDGYHNVMQNAFTALNKYQFRAMQFIVADRIGKRSDWSRHGGDHREKLMDQAEIREWIAAGHEIGSHTLTHSRLPLLNLKNAREEIFDSKKKLEDLFGVPIRHFAYPFGKWNEALRELVREADYKTACISRFGINVAETPLLELHRIIVRHSYKK